MIRQALREQQEVEVLGDWPWLGQLPFQQPWSRWEHQRIHKPWID